jgi:2-polyprenyl-6-methoxyphenol hydroxylase-like FAD-dependent oxidoreductase
METIKTAVGIVGGGPAGLMLAIELGCRGIDCMVLEEDADCPAFPKANATSARSMEHYRRRGFADAVRATGLPADHPQDVMYCTRYAGIELARFRKPSREQAAKRLAFGDFGESAWPTPELPHRAQQMYIEPILKREAEKHAGTKVRFGHRVVGFTPGSESSPNLLEIEAVATGIRSRVEARFVVGCDGPRSLVRKTLGIQYAGQSKEQRDFFGGQMLSIFFHSRDLYDIIGKERAWQYWAINREQRGLLISIDGIDTFSLGIQLKPGQTEENIDVHAAAYAAVGAKFDMRVIDKAAWLAGYTLVAEHFGAGSAFLAGDAAHLFTPTGGMGDNTSIDDTVNLGWKLAAVIDGWAAPALLDSYEIERRPIAHRNTNFARLMADSIGRIAMPANLEEAGPEGDAARKVTGAALRQHVSNEFNTPGLALGLCYVGSPVVTAEAGAPPPDDPNHYVPSGYPGARAPHMEVGEKSLLDLFGRDFTLAVFDAAPADDWEAIATRLGIPLQVLRLEGDLAAQARALYGADRALIRPDHHIAWRGDAAAAAETPLLLATGRLLFNGSRGSAPAETPRSAARA